jgi:hypothetical protein
VAGVVVKGVAVEEVACQPPVGPRRMGSVAGSAGHKQTSQAPQAILLLGMDTRGVTCDQVAGGTCPVVEWALQQLCVPDT